MTDAWHVTTTELRSLRSALLRRARTLRVPDMDVDDVVDRAIAKAAREPLRRDSPSIAVRAQVALHDETVDYFRRRAARVTVDYSADWSELAAEIPSGPEDFGPFHRAAIKETLAQLRQALGDETFEYALLVSAGYSEAEIAQRHGWTRLRAGRVRRRLGNRIPDGLELLVNADQRRRAS